MPFDNDRDLLEQNLLKPEMRALDRDFSVLEKKHTYTIYAIDFDGTICDEEYPKIGKAHDAVVQFIKAIQERRDKWILLTMRQDRYLEEAIDWLLALGLVPDVVNDNLPERIREWHNNPRKVYADIYIDDHNAGGLVLPDEATKENERKDYGLLQKLYAPSDAEKRKNDMHEILCSAPAGTHGTPEKLLQTIPEK